LITVYYIKKNYNICIEILHTTIKRISDTKEECRKQLKAQLVHLLKGFLSDIREYIFADAYCVEFIELNLKDDKDINNELYDYYCHASGKKTYLIKDDDKLCKELIKHRLLREREKNKKRINKINEKQDSDTLNPVNMTFAFGNSDFQFSNDGIKEEFYTAINPIIYKKFCEYLKKDNESIEEKLSHLN